MVTVYHRDQAGAPALAYGASSPIGFNAMKAILKACLVEGYTGKPAAGWELISEGSSFLVLRNGSHSGYVGFELNAHSVRVYLSETYTGMSGNVMTGVGVKSGNRTDSSLPQAVQPRYIAENSDSSSWAVIADERTAILLIWGTNGSVPHELTSAQHMGGGVALYIGEDTDGNLISCGGAPSSVTNSATANISGALDGAFGFTVLKNPDTGLLVGASAIDIFTPGGLGSIPAGSQTNVIWPIEQVSLLPVRWGSGHPAGRLRGIAACPELANVTWPSYAAQCLGHPGPLTTRTGNTPIGLGDGHVYFVRAGYYERAFWLATDNPGFW